MKVTLASMEYVDLLTELAVVFRDHQGRSSPTSIEISGSIQSLIVGGDAEFFVAVTAGRTGAGFVQLRYRYSMWLSAYEAHLEDLFIAPSYRRRRLGTNLVEHALGRAVEKGCASVVVDTNERNVPAIRLYEKLGFSSSSNRWDAGRQLQLRKQLSW